MVYQSELRQLVNADFGSQKWAKELAESVKNTIDSDFGTIVVACAILSLAAENEIKRKEEKQRKLEEHEKKQALAQLKKREADISTELDSIADSVERIRNNRIAAKKVKKPSRMGLGIGITLLLAWAPLFLGFGIYNFGTYGYLLLIFPVIPSVIIAKYLSKKPTHEEAQRAIMESNKYEELANRKTIKLIEERKQVCQSINHIEQGIKNERHNSDS